MKKKFLGKRGLLPILILVQVEEERKQDFSLA